jgi:outer membrane lipoprotein LolB
MFLTRLKRVFAPPAWLALLLVAGCATTPDPATLEVIDDAWTLRRDALMQLQRWDLSGRISVTVAHQAWQANLIWTQRGQNFLLDVSGPLNQGRLVVAGGPHGVRAERHDGRVVTAPDVESLLSQELGWTLPMSGLRHWVKGVPEPNAPTQTLELDELGRLASLDQLGWQILYTSYLESTGVDLPRKIRLESGDISVRMVVDEWTESL